MCFGRPVTSARMPARASSRCSRRDDAPRCSARGRAGARRAASRSLVGVGLEHAQREVLELPLELPDAEPVGERREEIERLARRALPRLVTSARLPSGSAAPAVRSASLISTTRMSSTIASSILRSRSACAARSSASPCGAQRADLVHPRDAGDERRDVGAEARADLLRVEGPAPAGPISSAARTVPASSLRPARIVAAPSRAIDERLAVARAAPQRSRA